MFMENVNDISVRYMINFHFPLCFLKSMRSRSE